MPAVCGLLLGGLLLVVGCSSGGPSQHVLPSAGSLDRLDAAVRAVGADRAAALDAVFAVQAAAAALDATDQVCTTGRGVAARTSHRKAVPLARGAQTALTRLVSLLPAYRASLTSLGAASVAVDGVARQALLRVVTRGSTEADALEGFRVVAAGAWPQYAALDAAEDTWITRAVTPWYRTDQEGAAAYAVLVGDQRSDLNAARARLGKAEVAVRAPIEAQSATLAAADQALASVRAKN